MIGTIFARWAMAAMVAMAAIGVPATVVAQTGGTARPAAPIVIVALGDSLTAGYQLPPSASFPAQLERALRARGHAVTVVNSGVSGDTSGAALERLDWAIPDGADAAIVELGANDALRGLAPAVARANLDRILAALGKRGMNVLLAGMIAPRNWGPQYAQEFDSIYPELARRHGAQLYPFFLDGVALRPELNQADGLHPTETGIAVIVERILPEVEGLIGAVRARRDAGKG